MKYRRLKMLFSASGDVFSTLIHLVMMTAPFVTSPNTLIVNPAVYTIAAGGLFWHGVKSLGSDLAKWVAFASIWKLDDAEFEKVAEVAKSGGNPADEMEKLSKGV